MTREELMETDKYYQDHIEEWRFLDAAFSGAKDLIKYGILGNDFKDQTVYQKNGAAYGYNYTARINGILTNFIANSNFIHSYGAALSQDESFLAFLRDCNGIGTSYNVFWNEVREVVSCMGHCGVVVDQAAGGSAAELKAKKIYPFVQFYNPINILQMQISINPDTARPEFSRIKLHENNPERVIILEKNFIEIWDLPVGSGGDPVLSDTIPNELGFIPFHMFINIRKKGKKWDTLSSVRGVADIDAAMVRDAIRVEKTIHNAAFSNLVLPAREHIPGQAEQTKKTGVSQIWTETPETKGITRWLSVEIAGILAPMLEVHEVRRREIYFMSDLAMILASDSKQPRSAESQEQSFKFLEGRLRKMVDNELEARRAVIKFWLSWQRKIDLFDDVNIGHDYEFNVQDLVSGLEDLLTEKSLLQASGTAQKELSKIITRRGSLKESPPEIIKRIDREIDEYEPVAPESIDLI